MVLPIEALAKGHKLLKKAKEWQEAGPFVIIKKYKRNIKDYLKAHSKKYVLPLSGCK